MFCILFVYLPLEEVVFYKKVYSNEVLLERLTEEEHEFVGAIVKLVQAQENYEKPLVF